MNKRVKKYLAAILSLAMAMQLAAFSVQAASVTTTKDGLYTGFAQGDMRTYENMSSALSQTAISDWGYVSTQRGLAFYGIGDASELDESRPSGDYALKTTIDTTTINDTTRAFLEIPTNISMKKGDIFTLSFDYGKTLNVATNSAAVIVEMTTATKGISGAYKQSKTASGATAINIQNFSDYGRGGFWIVGEDYTKSWNNLPGFHHYEMVINTQDEDWNGAQTMAVYQDGTLMGKVEYYQCAGNNQDTARPLSNPIDKVSRLKFTLLNTQMSQEESLYFDNLSVQVYRRAQKAKDAIYASAKVDELTTYSYSYNVQTGSSEPVVEFTEETNELQEMTFTAPDGAESTDTTVAYRSFMAASGAGVMNMETEVDTAYILADINVPAGSDVNDYYVVLASAPNAVNGNLASATGVKLSDYYSDGDERVRIPLTAFNANKAKQFVNGGVAYSKIDFRKIAGIGIAYSAAADAGETSAIQVGDIYIVNDFAGPSDLAVKDIRSGCTVLEWAESANTANSYELYRDDELIATLPGTTTEYTDDGLENNRYYNYALRAESLYGTYSEKIKLENVYVSELGKPTAFEAVNVGGDKLAASLSWDVPEYGEPDKYRIYRDGKWIADVDGETFTYEDAEGLTADTTYTYAVYSSTEDNVESLPTEQSLMVAYLYAPQNLAYAADAGEYGKLTWNASDDHAAIYTIYCNGKEYATSTETEYVFEKQLSYNDMYTFMVTASTAAGKESAASAEVKEYPVDPTLNVVANIYQDALNESYKTETSNAAVDAANTENVGIGAKSMKIDFQRVANGRVTMQANKAYGDIALKSGGVILLGVYVPEGTDLSKIQVGLSYTPSAANATPAVAGVSLEDYVKETGRWTVAEIPVADLPARATYTSGSQEKTLDFNVASAKGISIVGDYETSSTASTIYVDEICVAQYVSGAVTVTDADGTELSTLPANADAVYLKFENAIDVATLTSGDIAITDAEGNAVLTASEYIAASKTIKVRLLSALAVNTEYTLTVGGLQEKNGAVVSYGKTLRTDAAAPQTEFDRTLEMVTLTTKGAKVGSAAQADIAFSDPAVSPLNPESLTLTIQYNTNILNTGKSSIKLSGALENALVNISDDTVTITAAELTELTADSSVLVYFTGAQRGTADISVSGTLVTSDGIELPFKTKEGTIQITAASGGGNGGGGSPAGYGYGGGRETVTVAPGTTTDTNTSNTLTDVATSHWAYSYIKALQENNILRGYEDGTFRPEQSVTREEFTVMLTKAFKLPAGEENIFTDVADGMWYADAVKAAASAGVVSGRPDATFGIGDAISREDMCVMLSRLIALGNVTTSDTYDAVVFTDADAIADYAKEAVAELQKKGVVSGYDTGDFQPKGNVTRAAAATVIARLLGL